MVTYAQQKREQISREIERRGLRCIQQGKGWHVSGKGVDIVTTDLQYVRLDDLRSCGYVVVREGMA